MTPVLQTRKDGSGDCVRACIAGLLNMKIEQVPDWMESPEALKEHETGYEIWYLAMQKWLAAKGYMFVEIQLASKTWMPLPCETLAIFIGMRETPAGSCRHAIVGKCEGDTFFPIFDPLGGNPLEAFKDNRILAVCFLVPIDPALIVALGMAVDKTIRLARQLPWSEIKETILAICNEAIGLAQIQLPASPDANASRIILPGA